MSGATDAVASVVGSKRACLFSKVSVVIFKCDVTTEHTSRMALP